MPAITIKDLSMLTLEAILALRSIRNFVKTQVEPEKIEILLRAAMYAPSAMNEQPWRLLLQTACCSRRSCRFIHMQIC